MSQREGANRFAFAFADFSNWQATKRIVSRDVEDKRREERGSIHIVQDNDQHMRRISQFTRDQTSTNTA